MCPVYEATTEEQYKKVMNFINSQPKGSFPHTCFNAPGLQGRQINELKTAYPNLQILVVEDNLGKIHEVVIGHFVDYDNNGELVKMVSNLGTILDYQDYNTSDYTYQIELIEYTKANFWKKGIRFTQITVPKELLDFEKKSFGDPLEVVHTYEASSRFAGDVVLKIDNKKYAGV